jgi:DNA uptake protein ComE-like DNA-binding protein
VDDLTKVKGIGQATVDKNRANLTIGTSNTK